MPPRQSVKRERSVDETNGGAKRVKRGKLWLHVQMGSWARVKPFHAHVDTKISRFLRKLADHCKVPEFLFVFGSDIFINHEKRNYSADWGLDEFLETYAIKVITDKDDGKYPHVFVDWKPHAYCGLEYKPNTKRNLKKFDFTWNDTLETVVYKAKQVCPNVKKLKRVVIEDKDGIEIESFDIEKSQPMMKKKILELIEGLEVPTKPKYPHRMILEVKSFKTGA